MDATLRTITYPTGRIVLWHDVTSGYAYCYGVTVHHQYGPSTARYCTLLDAERQYNTLATMHAAQAAQAAPPATGRRTSRLLYRRSRPAVGSPDSRYTYPAATGR